MTALTRPARVIRRLAEGLAGVALLAGAAAAGEVDVTAKWALRSDLPDVRDPRNVIELSFRAAAEDGGRGRRLLAQDGEGLLVGAGASLDPAAYALRVERDGIRSSIPVDVRVPDPGETLAGSLILIPASPPDPRNEYSLSIRPNAIAFRVEGRDVLYEGKASITLDSEGLRMNAEFLEPKTLERWIEFNGGSGGGTGVLRFRHEVYRERSSGRLRVDLAGSADVTLDGADRGEYFDELTGEMSLVRAGRASILGAERYVEVGVHYRVESDQEADNADQLAGIRLATYLKDPVSTFLSEIFVDEGEAVVAPLFIVEYDYADEIARRTWPGRQEKPDVDGGSGRLEAAVYWSLPVARRLDLRLIPAVGAISDVDLLVEAKGLYDFSVSRFRDRSRLGLQFTPAAAGDFKPAFQVTWARGQSAPIFRQVSAVLAGIKLTF